MTGAFGRALDSDFAYSFRRSPVAVVATLIVVVFGGAALLAPLVSPSNPFDLASLSLMDSFTPPSFLGGESTHLLGTDDQGRDMLSAIIYGLRISLVVGLSAVVFATVVGIGFGLVAGYFGGVVDAVLMRVADVQLTFPAILIALLVDGVVSAVLPRTLHDAMEVYVLIFAIGISRWPQFAPHRAQLHDGGARAGLRAGRPGDRPVGAADHVHAYPAECDRPGGGDRPPSISACRSWTRRRCPSSAWACRRRSLRWAR